MNGLPSEVLITACIALVGATVLLVIWLEARSRRQLKEPGAKRFDLLRYRPIAALVRWRPFQFVLRLPFVLLFFLIIISGFLGNQVMGRNIAPVLTWTIWWAALIVAVPFLGKIWCLVCPWNAIAEWIQRFSFWRVKRMTTSMNLPWPKALQNVYPAIGLFVVLTWLELGVGVTTSATATAGLAVIILILAVLPAMYFDRKPFCRHGCLVGMVSGAYAQMSNVEVRPRDREVCHACRTKDCLKGNKAGYGCPVSVYLGTMDRDTYCIQCTECVKTCPRGNVSYNLRLFASSVIHPTKLRVDEAYMAIVIFGLTFFHGVAMSSFWMDALNWTKSAVGGDSLGIALAFTAGMFVVLVVPGLVYLLGAFVAKLLGGGALNLRSAFIGFSTVLLPVAIFYHLAHNFQHLLQEGQRLVPLLSDPLGWGWNLFGTAGMQLSPLVPLEWIQVGQVALLVLGQLYGVYLTYRLGRAWGIYGKSRLRVVLPIVAVVLVLSLADLWLLSMPMQMRMEGSSGMSGM